MFGSGSAIGRLAVEIVGDASRLTKDLDAAAKDVGDFAGDVERQSGKMTGSLSNMGTKIAEIGKKAALAFGAVAVAIGTAAVMAADQVDQAYATIRVGTGATGEALQDLKDDFHEVYGEIPASAESVGTAIADLNTRLGLTGDALQEMATQYLELSRITGTDVAENIQTATRTFGDWNVAVDEQSDALNYLFLVSQNTGVAVTSLNQKMVQYGAPLRQMGFGFETAAALMGKFEKEGVNTELVLGSLRIALSNMAQEGITDTNAALSTLIDRIQSAGSVGEANALAIETFGSRAGPDMAAAIREGRFEIDELLATLQGSEETILTAAADAMTLGDRMEILKARASEALLPVGNLLIGMFEDSMPLLEAGIAKVSEWGEAFGDWLAEAQQDAAPFISMVEEKLAPAIDFYQERLQYLVEWWEENSDLFIAAWNNIAAAIEWVINTVIVPLFEWAWPYLEQIISGNLDAALGVVKLFTSILAGDWESAGDALVDISLGIMKALEGIFSMGFDAIAAGVEWVMNGIAEFMTNVWKGIVQAVEDSINAMIDLINGFIRGINSVTEKVGISLPTIARVELQAAAIEAPTFTTNRWADMKAAAGIPDWDEIGNILKDSRAARDAGNGEMNVTINQTINTQSQSAMEVADATKRGLRDGALEMGL